MMSLPWKDQHRPAWRRFTFIMASAAVAVMPIGCGNPELSVPTRAAGVDIPIPVFLFGAGALAEPSATGKAITYNPDLAPAGAVATAFLAILPLPDGSTRARLTVFGLLPNRGYAAHAHTNACGLDPAAAGPHFQHQVPPPGQPSGDPAYANPTNEIWLDLQTNALGAGTSSATVPFALTDRVPGSIVIHAAMKTSTDPGQAGTAGARIACLTLGRS